jgi:hypothetical protein
MVATFASLLMGCGASQTEQQHRSWLATGKLVASAWRHGDLPRRYAVDTLQVVESETHDPAVANEVATIERRTESARP